MNASPNSPAGLASFGSRLTTLCDGRAGLRGGLRVDAREAGSPADSCSGPVIEFTASDETLDRCNEVICASGWQLDAYRRNPVFQNAHQYGDILFTLGRALVTEVRAGRLFQRVEFATGVSPMARIAYGLYRGRFLNAVSVGFVPLRWEDMDGAAPCRRRYLQQELLEVSAVSIPANPNALQLGLKAGFVERRDIRDLLDVLQARPDQGRLQAPGGRTAAAGEPVSAVPDLFAFARELRRIMRA